jgi:hypothetical protein
MALALLALGWLGGGVTKWELVGVDAGQYPL